MTMQADQLIGAQVTGADGQPVGFVDEVFRDDVDGTPSWVRVRSGGREHLVPLTGCAMTARGLSVPFDARQIAGEPAIDADSHLSAAQEAQLRGYFGLVQPAQAAQADEAWTPAGWAATPAGWVAAPPGWLVLTEERVEVETEVVESGRVRLHRYVDTEPIERVVHVFYEEYEVEHIPIPPGEPADDALGESEQELVLHEERAVFRKEAVPVERVRLSARRVEEDRTFRGEIRRERVEIETQPTARVSRLGSDEHSGA